MPSKRQGFLSLPIAAVVLLSGLAPDARASDAPRIVVTYSSDKSDSFLYGRLLLLFSTTRAPSRVSRSATRA